ncbi:MAG: TIGR02449 family protein [Hahellaceae bacterium]|nr:TIGR02449 family protein [Hahellaceae bacterium]
MTELTLEALSEKVNRLVDYCEQLRTDNQAMRQLQDDWHKERSQLMQKNDLARNKIEAMIGRLKALEQK